MAADKLRIYNTALGHLGERKLASLNEQREPKRVLDDFYDGVVAHCLELGNWTFVAREAMVDADTTVVVDFGYRNAFGKPGDWVRTIAISDGEFFNPPLTRYKEEGGKWYADCNPLFVRYVSNDPTAGGLDLSRWSQLFEDYVALRLARVACQRISGAESRAEVLKKEERKALAEARDHDMANRPPQAQPSGSWVQSRGGGSRASRWDRRAL